MVCQVATHPFLPRLGSSICSDLPGDGYQLATEERVPKRLRVAGNSKDIFCLVKMNMSDTVLCQDPLLVYPAGLQASSDHFWDRISRNTHHAVIQQKLDGERAAELTRLAKTLKADFPHFHRTYQYYEMLMDENRLGNLFRSFCLLRLAHMPSRGLAECSLGNAQRHPSRIT